MKKFKKLSHYTDMVRTSEKNCQEENFILGLVKFFENFNVFYKLISLMEEEYKVNYSILPSFNHNSEDEVVSNFKLLRIKLDKDILDKVNKDFSSIQYKEKTFNFKFFLEDSQKDSITIQIELI